MLVICLGLINVVYSADFYGVLRDPNNPGKRPGICSIKFGEDKLSVNATANNLKDKRAYSAWVIFASGTEGSSTAHLDGTIGPKGKSYKFQGDLAQPAEPFFTIQVQVREHPKVRNDTTVLQPRQRRRPGPNRSYSCQAGVRACLRGAWSFLALGAYTAEHNDPHIQ